MDLASNALTFNCIHVLLASIYMNVQTRISSDRKFCHHVFLCYVCCFVRGLSHPCNYTGCGSLFGIFIFIHRVKCILYIAKHFI